MRKAVACVALAAGVLVGAGLASAADKPLIGIVSIAATEANNVRYINGATKAAEELGWEVSVIDAVGLAPEQVVEALLPPTHTVEPLLKFWPVTVTCVPPASGPEVGLMLLNVGLVEPPLPGTVKLTSLDGALV